MDVLQTKIRGASFPQDVVDLIEIWADVSYGNDEADSLVLYGYGCIWKLWVGSCCPEQRGEHPRFMLQRYTGEVPSDIAALVRRGLHVVGGTRLPTSQQLAAWHDGWASSDAWDEVWEGEDPFVLVAELDRLVDDCNAL